MPTSRITGTKILSIEADYDSNELRPVYYYESNNSSEGKIYTTLGKWGNAVIAVYNEDGSLDRNMSVAQSISKINDIVLDANGTIFIAEYYAVTCLDNDGTFKWRTGNMQLKPIPAVMEMKKANSTNL